MSPAPNIVLVGFMGTGKSVVSRALARRLDWKHVDTDELIAVTTGRTIPEIFAQDGEAHFRDLEGAVIHDLEGTENAVISTGGGAVLREANMRRLRGLGLTVHLTASVEAIVERCRQGERPLLEVDDPERRVRELLAQRAPHYAKAHVSVDTTGLAVEEIVERIEQLWRESETT